VGEGAKRVTTLISGDAAFQKRARGSTPGALSPSRALGEVWALQRDRWILWAPVAVIAGAALWLTSPTDPPIWLGVAGLLAGIGGALTFSMWPSDRHDGPAALVRGALGGLCVLVAALGLGLCAAQMRAAVVATAPFPALNEPTIVEGWVVAIDSSDSGPRLRLQVRHVDGVDPAPR
jgi:competence protein ComEC